MISMKLFALALFVLMYVLMITKPAHRPLYALGVAVIYLLTGVLPVRELFGTINWNVLMMISGTMIIVDFFIESRMPHLLADILLEKAPEHTELVITGRCAPNWLIERADLVTEMKEVKHYYTKGVEARKGIEC